MKPNAAYAILRKKFPDFRAAQGSYVDYGNQYIFNLVPCSNLNAVVENYYGVNKVNGKIQGFSPVMDIEETGGDFFEADWKSIEE